MRWPWSKRPMVAAAQPIQPGWKRTERKLRTGKQKRAAFFAAELGVAGFASNLLADAGSRCTLRVEECVDRRHDTWEPCEDAIANEYMTRYRGRSANQRELVRQHIYQYQTVGEAVQYYEDVRGKVCWAIASPFQAKWGERGVTIQLAPGGTVREGLAVEVPIEYARRVWIPDDQWPALATSPLMRVVEDCERYWSLGRRIRRETESALAGNKIIWTPSEAHTELARDQREPGQPGQPGTDLERDYYMVASRIFDPENDSVESIAPIMWRWSDKYKEPKVIDLGAPIDAQTLAARVEALECIARGLNFPLRLLVTGIGEGNHWSDWLLSESLASDSLAPLLERVCWGDLTETFLRPGLIALNARALFTGDPDDYRVGFDMTPVVVHPNQSAQAIELNKLGLLNDSKTLELSGFDPADMPRGAELGRWIMRTQILANKPLELPLDGATTNRGIPQQAALDARSEIRETVPVGPLAGEEVGWLDA